MVSKSLCDLCHKTPVKISSVAYDDRVVNVCGRCHRKITGAKAKRRRLAAPGQKLFPFAQDAPTGNPATGALSDVQSPIPNGPS